MFTPPVVACDHCEGRGRILMLCHCVRWGDRFLIDTGDDIDPLRSDGHAYRDCELCDGSGYTLADCHECRRTGRRRAQLVLTVVNLDTGAVRSANVVPGGVEPRRGPAGRWELALSPVVAALAAEVDAVAWRDACRPANPTGNGFSILLPTAWRANLPTAERHRLEGEAIARRCWHPWLLYFGRTGTFPAPEEPDAVLGRLCHLADVLCLDLVVEARYVRDDRLNWDIRYEVPGGRVPGGHRGWADDLTAAVVATSVDHAMFGLTDRSLTAPAHYLQPHPPEQIRPPNVATDQVERRIHADLDGLDGRSPGAQAIWRDGRWHHTRLRVDDTIEVMTALSTGQVVRKTETVLVRAWEPPAPGWQGEPVPYRPCPDCHPENRLRRCVCTLGNQPPKPDCSACAGAGYTSANRRCPTCHDSHRIYEGVVVTLTGPGDAARHLNWPLPDRAADATYLAAHPGGKPIFQLPVHYQVRHWAEILGARPADLTYLDGGHHINQNLSEGTVTVDHPRIDPLAEYIADASRGQPAARLLLNATPPPAAHLPDLIRLALGLHQTLVVTLQDHWLNEHDPRCVHGECWSIALLPPDQLLPPDPHPFHPTVEAAAAYLLEYLENALYDVVSEDPQQGIPVPQTPQPAPLVDNPVPLIRRLARHHAGRPVSIRYHHTGCHLHVYDRNGKIHHLATARTVPIALTALGLGRS